MRICLEFGIGRPTKPAQDGSHSTAIIAPRNPLGTDPLALRRANQLAADRAEMQELPAKRRDIAPGPLTKAIQKAAGAMPEVMRDPQDPSLELTPVTDADLPDDPDLS